MAAAKAAAKAAAEVEAESRKKRWVDWSGLPSDAINFISTRLATNADHVRLRSVCTSWRSSAPKRALPPWLLVLHSHSDLLLFTFPNLTLHLPAAATPRAIFRCGASFGWIARLHDSHGAVSIYNPFTAAEIPLPLPRLHKPLTFDKALLSADPAKTPDGCQALALCCSRGTLIHCRLGASHWTPLWPDFSNYFFQDIVFYNGMFYAVSKYRLFLCDVDRAWVNEIVPADPMFSDGRLEDDPAMPLNRVNSYLVVSSGDLLLVAISFDRQREYFTDHEVFRVDLDEGKARLVKMDNLRGRALFVSRESVSLPSGDSPWCKANCVYYIDIKRDRIRVFNMEDDSARSITSLNGGVRGAQWIVPSF